MYVCTLPKTNMAPENRPCPKGRIVSQSPFFVGYVSFRECLSWHLKKSWGETLTFIRNFDQLAAEPRKWLLFSFEKGDQNVNTFSTTLDFQSLTVWFVSFLLAICMMIPRKLGDGVPFLWAVKWKIHFGGGVVKLHFLTSMVSFRNFPLSYNTYTPET